YPPHPPPDISTLSLHDALPICCIVKCSNVINDAGGTYVTSALEFETIALCGSNCAIADLDKVAQLDRLCDELGLDTIETGGAIRSEEHTSELQSRSDLVCRLLL